jgi:hypothetical protein
VIKYLFSSGTIGMRGGSTRRRQSILRFYALGNQANREIGVGYFAARNPSTVWINRSGWSTKVMCPLWGMTASFDPTILSLM